jgi:sialidase-1
MTVRWSDDDGKSWPGTRVLFSGHSAYSALAALNENEIGLLYERGEKSPYEMIAFERVTLD